MPRSQKAACLKPLTLLPQAHVAPGTLDHKPFAVLHCTPLSQMPLLAPKCALDNTHPEVLQVVQVVLLHAQLDQLVCGPAPLLQALLRIPCCLLLLLTFLVQTILAFVEVVVVCGPVERTLHQVMCQVHSRERSMSQACMAGAAALSGGRLMMSEGQGGTGAQPWPLQEVREQCSSTLAGSHAAHHCAARI